VVLATETSAQKAAAACDSTAIRIKDVEEWAALAERKTQERVSRVEAENATVLASPRKDAEGLVQKIALLEVELVEMRRAREVAKENTRGLSNATADVVRRWEMSKRECQQHFEELTLLRTQGFELCLAIVGPPRVRNHLSEGMRLAVLRHT
jgi:hypothetical protein